MNEARINQLTSFIQEDPNDTFSLYALALEYQTEVIDKALPLFRKLLGEFPNYTATYYHAAALMVEMELIDEARATYEKGIEQCEIAQEAHALKELKNAYLNFTFEHDI